MGKKLGFMNPDKKAEKLPPNLIEKEIARELKFLTEDYAKYAYKRLGYSPNYSPKFIKSVLKKFAKTFLEDSKEFIYKFGVGLISPAASKSEVIKIRSQLITKPIKTVSELIIQRGNIKKVIPQLLSYIENGINKKYKIP